MAAPVDRYAVMGNPVTHSKSPMIHAMFAKSTRQQLHYEALEIENTHFETAVADFFNNGDQGLSITVPFKERAWELAKVKTERAKKAGAVNTLWLSEDGYLSGDNTDGLGLIRDLTENNELSLAGLRVLVLGAGGAVRGIMDTLLHEQPTAIVIANRTVSKAQELADIFRGDYAGPEDVSLSASSFEALEGAFDLIINGTSASLQGKELAIPASIVTPDTVSYDMMYGAEETVFNQWARNAGARLRLDGLGMLVEQAAEQFLIWRGVRPETSEVLQLLRKILTQK